MNAWVLGTQQRMGKVCSFQNVIRLTLFAGFLGLFFVQNAHAQSSDITWIDHVSYKVGYQFSSSSQTFQANEHISVNLFLETTSPTEVIGGYFDLTVSSLVDEDPNSAFKLPSPSNLGYPDDLKTEYSWDPGTHESHLEVSKLNNIPQSCSGQIASLEYVVGSLEVDAEDLVQAFDGGTMIMENIDMRLATGIEDETNDALQVFLFPNPFTDKVTLKHQLKGDHTFRLRNLGGKLLFESQLAKTQKLDLQSYPRGMYILEVLDTEGRQVYTKKIVKR